MGLSKRSQSPVLSPHAGGILMLGLSLFGGCARAESLAQSFDKPVLAPRSLASAAPRSLPISSAQPIAIDPGHGGRDIGARCLHRKLLEKKLNLETAIGLRTILAKRGFATFLSRQRDEYVGLDERARRANARRSSVLVSIHHNWAQNRKAHGIEIFYPHDPANPQRAVQARHLAELILQKLKSRGFAVDRGAKPAKFRVLRATRMPAVLVECGFMSNLHDLRQLGTVQRRRAISAAIAEGIESYLLLNASQPRRSRAPSAAQRSHPIAGKPFAPAN